MPRHLLARLVLGLTAALSLAACGADAPTAPTIGGSSVVTAGATLAASRRTTCALGSGGRAFCWGSQDGWGALGNPAATRDTAHAVPVAGGRAYAGLFMTSTNYLDVPVTVCALTPEGAAECWGGNQSGLLGPQVGPACAGARSCLQSPQPVPTALRFRRLAIGVDFLCGIATDGATHCWGLGTSGQLGNAAFASSTTPTPVAGGLRFTDIVASVAVACGLTGDGAAYCWGEGSSGQLGDGRAQRSATPVRVNATTPFTRLAVVERYVCGLTPSGGGACWGWGAYWTLGAAANPTRFRNANIPAPEALTLPGEARSITLGSGHACTLQQSGAAVCWGWNPYNQVGPTGRSGCRGAELEAECTPAPVAPGLSFVELRAGSLHTCGRATDAAVYCWGQNVQRQVGGGLRASLGQPDPVRVDLP